MACSSSGASRSPARSRATSTWCRSSTPTTASSTTGSLRRRSPHLRRWKCSASTRRSTDGRAFALAALPQQVADLAEEQDLVGLLLLGLVDLARPAPPL